MKATLCLFAALAALSSVADTAAPADDLARQTSNKKLDIPTAPEGYRRPKDWKPTVPYPKTLAELARDNSAEMSARAKVQMEKVDKVNAEGPYHATGSSIDTHKCPEWFVDAKLGIFIDWGPWSVASWCPYVKGARLYPDWYEKRLDEDFPAGSPLNGMRQYHEKNWGKDFKRDHLLQLFRGTSFDATDLMHLFAQCGAKYVVTFSKHHGGYCLWDSSYTFRDSMDREAHRDFTREIAQACRAEGLKFGPYISQAAEWEYPILQADGSIKMWKEGQRMEPYTSDMEYKCSGKVPVKDFFRDYSVPQITEYVDKYHPDLLWYDYDWVTTAKTNMSYDISAYFYNEAAKRHQEVAVNDRYGNAEPEDIKGKFPPGYRWHWLRTVRGDFYTDEWGDTTDQIDPSKWHPWESCSGISKSYGNHWMESFDKSMVMTEREFVIHFSDIVARGGNLLLLVNLDPQGAIPDVQRERLKQIGQWLETYGEAIYGTRICAPYKTDDIDYTQSKDGVFAYAIVKNPKAEILLTCKLPKGTTIHEIESDLPLKHEAVEGGTKVFLPDSLAKREVPFALRCTR